MIMTNYWLTLCLPGVFIIPSCSAWMFHLTLALDTFIWWRPTNAYLMKTNKCRHVSIWYRGVAKIFRMRKQAVKEMRTQSAQRKFGVIILHYFKKKRRRPLCASCNVGYVHVKSSVQCGGQINICNKYQNFLQQLMEGITQNACTNS